MSTLELNRWHQGQPRQIRVKTQAGEFLLLISETDGVELHARKGSAWKRIYPGSSSVADRALRVIWGDILGATGEPTPFGVVEALRERLPDGQD